MKIDFKKIITDWNKDHPEDRLSQTTLAREMVMNGIFKNEHSAINMMQYHSSGKALSIDYEMLTFLQERLQLTSADILA